MSSSGDTQRGDLSARLYRRFGARIWWLVLVIPVGFTPVTAVVVLAIVDRYFGISFAQAAKLLWAAPVVCTLGIVGLFIPLRRWRTVLSWRGQDRTPERAPQTWHALLGARSVLGSGLAVALIGFVPAMLLLVRALDKPLWVALPLGLACLVAAFNHWALTVPLVELAVRPMLEDVATYLPPDFEPPQTQRLRTKALLPLPAVLLFAALAVGGYANLSANGPERLSLALAIGTVTVALATIIFFIGARALIEPVDDLIAATQRVRAGDLETPVPIVTGDELGVLSHSFNQMLEGLREREALLEHNTELAEALRGSLTRIVTAAAAERRRVERDLHDGAQQHLVLLKLKLGLLESAAADDPKLIALVREMRDDLAAALAELRDLAHGIYPAALANDGLPGALRDAAGRAGIPATLEADGAGRYSPEVETAVYFCCLEALQNAAKHAGDGATATIRLEAVDGALKFEVADDGVGYEPSKVEDHGGLQNMTDRIGALGGRVWITSKPGQGTVVAGELSVRPVG